MLKVKNRPFMTIPEVSEEFGFPASTVRRLIQDEAFPVMKVGRTTYIMREAFEGYLSSVSSMSDSSTSQAGYTANMSTGTGDNETVETTESIETVETAATEETKEVKR